MTAMRTPLPEMGTRVLGVVGVLGGLGLLAAFIAEIPVGWNPARLVLFAAGAMAVAVAAHAPHAAASRPLALAATVPLLLANGAQIAWVVLAQDRERPFAGGFGMVGFWVGLAFWLADAWFGLIALRLGVLWRWAALALVVGSLAAIVGMDRLELTSQANPTIFGPIGLAGVALNGLAWFLFGLELAVPRLRGTRVAAIGDAPGA